MNNPQQIAELIRLQTTLQKISIRQMLKDIGLGVNSLSHLDNGSMPKADNLGKIALYLNVSVDYLLGLTDNPNGGTGSNTSINQQYIGGDANASIEHTKKSADSISGKFMEIFNNLPFEEQLAVMNFAVEKSKKYKEN